MLECTIRVANSSNVGTTGLTGSNIKFRRDPFGSGDEITIAGVSGGTNGIYLCSFIGVPYQAAQLWIDGVYQSTWGTKYIGDVFEEFLSTDTTTEQDIVSDIDMNSKKLKGLAAGTTNGDSVRYEQVIRTSGAQTGISGTKVFTDLLAMSPSTITITGDGTLTTKKYVDDLYGTVVGVIQSTYLNKLIPLRAIEDAYSHTTPELCYAYLSSLTDISTRSGTVLIEPSGLAGNVIDVDNHATNQWIGDGVFYVALGKKPIINRKGYNSSLTTTGGLVNCRIKDGTAGTPVVSARTYINFTFQDCEFDVPDATDITFTTCKFLGTNKLKSASGNTITLTNCTGDMFWHNDDITPTISGTQPCDVRAVTAANLNF